jgi:hypothetical protein
MSKPLERWVIEYIGGPADGRLIGIEDEGPPIGQTLTVFYDEGTFLYRSNRARLENGLVKVWFVSPPDRPLSLAELREIWDEIEPATGNATYLSDNPRNSRHLNQN